MRFIDCPVTGGLAGARNGTLTLLIGAREEDLADATRLLGIFSNKIIHLGLPGAGTTYKLIANLMAAVHIVALAEGIAMAEKAKLNLQAVLEGLTTGGVASPIVRAFANQMASGNHNLVNFSVRLMHKDVAYAAQIANALGQNTPLSHAAIQAYCKAIDQGKGDLSVSSIIDVVR